MKLGLGLGFCGGGGRLREVIVGWCLWVLVGFE